MAHEATINVRHRIGLLGTFAVSAAALLSRIGITLPMRFVVWSVNHSSYYAIGRGKWVRFNPGLDLEEIR